LAQERGGGWTTREKGRGVVLRRGRPGRPNRNRTLLSVVNLSSEAVNQRPKSIKRNRKKGSTCKVTRKGATEDWEKNKPRRLLQQFSSRKKLRRGKRYSLKGEWKNVLIREKKSGEEIKKHSNLSQGIGRNESIRG